MALTCGDSMLIQPFVECVTFGEHALQRLRYGIGFLAIRSECRSVFDLCVPMLRPDAVRFAETGRPVEHLVAELKPDQLANSFEYAARIFEHVARVENRRHARGLVPNHLEDADL